MERKGGCCLAPRYGGAAATAHQAGAAWQMGRIMLKFRPIAPKPAAMAPAAAPTPVAGLAAVGPGRGKRKAVCGGGGGRRGRKPKKAATAAVVTAAAPAAPTAAAAAQDAGDCRKDCDKEKSSSRSSSSSGMTSVDSSPPPRHQLATLPLMPVTPPVVDKAAVAGAAAAVDLAAPVPSQVAAPAAVGTAGPLAPWAMRVGPAAAASLVTVEEVAATWHDGEAATPSAACVRSDEAPAFVSDQWGRVTWRNAAFVRAVSVSADDDGDEAETAPMVLGGALPAWGTCAGFTCRVRVGHNSSARRAGSSLVAPCDVWRLDAGGSYLWRLDLQAALSLGCRL